MEASGGVQPNLNLSIVREIAVPVPPAAEQVELVDRVRQALTMIAAAESRLSGAAERVESLERAALAKAFRGELVEQDPADEPVSALLDRLRRITSTENKPSPEPDRKARARSRLSEESRT